jgi:hypothetical protein
VPPAGTVTPFFCKQALNAAWEAVLEDDGVEDDGVEVDPEEFDEDDDGLLDPLVVDVDFEDVAAPPQAAATSAIPRTASPVVRRRRIEYLKILLQYLRNDTGTDSHCRFEVVGFM